jgi:hypothetical protein
MPLVKMGKCPICLKRLKLKKGNIIPTHKDAAILCAGSNKSGKNNNYEFKEVIK